jgi:NAD-dependent DNA ligase
LDALQKQLKDLKQQKTQLETTLKEAKAATAAISQTQAQTVSELTEAQQAIATLDTQVQTLESSRQQSLPEQDRLQQEHASLTQAREQLTRKLTSAQDDLKAAQQQRKTIQQNFEKVTQERDRLTQTLQEAQSTIATLQTQTRLERERELASPAVPPSEPSQEWIQSFESVQQERDRMMQELEAASQTVANLEQNLSAVQKEKSQLAEAMKMAKDVVAFLQQQVQDLTAQQGASSNPANPPLSPPIEEIASIPDVSVSMAAAPKAPASKDLPLEGKTFVITGKLETLSFEKVNELITASGGRINEKPSSKTSYVVVGQKPGSKLQKAEKYGISQLTEAELLQLLGQ